MALVEQTQPLDELCCRVQECISPFAGRVEYGNLRSRLSIWDCDGSDPVTNLALVYETPGGSTDQINISYNHCSGMFALVDEHEGELTIQSVEAVLERIRPRISGIPDKRRETLFAEVRREIDRGTSPTGLMGQINRVIQSEFKGGSITHLELRDAMLYAMQYMNARNGKSGPPPGAG